MRRLILVLALAAVCPIGCSSKRTKPLESEPTPPSSRFQVAQEQHESASSRGAREPFSPPAANKDVDEFVEQGADGARDMSREAMFAKLDAIESLQVGIERFQTASARDAGPRYPYGTAARAMLCMKRELELGAEAWAALPRLERRQCNELYRWVRSRGTRLRKMSDEVLSSTERDALEGAMNRWSDK